MAKNVVKPKALNSFPGISELRKTYTPHMEVTEVEEHNGRTRVFFRHKQKQGDLHKTGIWVSWAS